MDRQTSHSPKALVESDKPYVPHDVLDETAKTAVVGLGSGFFVAAIQNALSRGNVGAFSVFTRGAPIIGICAAGPGAYAFFSRTVMNLREKEDAWAATFGGFMCGSVLGLPFKRMPIVLGLGALVGGVQGTFHLMGNRLDSFSKEEDEFERKEIARRTTRLPIEQTIAEIGEGRGIRAPGYEERRRERIKEKYGFEINPVSATVEGSQ
ncbi:NADH-ubiquinone oxidoreductase 21.3 kDa subunit [Cladobotryum mycophilum]|uniref:NADH-ubiquinone oxidoreductase 21.3 kDa subunit n=1 Tax=Cladobotryum mycophilum TaxID=491253 RepID=A0ABR0SUA6_9HYPO